MNLKTALVLIMLVCSARNIDASAPAKTTSSTDSSSQPSLTLNALRVHNARETLAAAFDAYVTSMQKISDPSSWEKHKTLGRQLVAAKAAYYEQLESKE